MKSINQKHYDMFVKQKQTILQSVQSVYLFNLCLLFFFIATNARISNFIIWHMQHRRNNKNQISKKSKNHTSKTTC